MFVFGVANALGLARIQKQLIPDKLIPFLRKRWENAKFPYNSPPQAEIFGAQFKIMRKPFKIVIFSVHSPKIVKNFRLRRAVIQQA